MKLHKSSPYIVLLVLFVIINMTGMGVLLLSGFFSYFALDKLRCLKRKWLTLTFFFVLVAAIGVGLAFMIDQAVRHFPKVIDKAIPSIVEFGQKKNITLPFSDWGSLKVFLTDFLKGQVRYVGTFTVFTQAAGKKFIFMLIGIVIAVSVFVTPATDLKKEKYPIANNLYSVFWGQLSALFGSFYNAFKEVMSAQLVISTINTGLTSLFLLWMGMPYTPLLVAITFLCGLLPIVGNLVSNTVIVCVGFSQSLELGLWALAFLVVLHKLEYFLNSKIIGDRIKNPVWLTLIALLVGERLMGITGMILAPAALYFLKTEMTKIEIKE